MSRCVDKIEHDCGSTSLQVFERDDGDVDGYCFSCSTYVRNPYGDTAVEDRPKRKVKSQEDIQAEIAEISTYQTKTLMDRHLNRSSLETCLTITHTRRTE